MKGELLILGSVLFVNALIFGGCGPSTSQERSADVSGDEPLVRSVDVSCDDFMKLQHVGKEVEVAVGSSLTVALCSNPTTGFQWSETAQIGDPTVVGQTEHTYVIKEYGTLPPAGAPGKEQWTFKALKEGKSTVSFEYSQPWEGGEKAAWTFVLTVAVR
jgi:inhibitor of cysteine peptidase